MNKLLILDSSDEQAFIIKYFLEKSNTQLR